MGFCNQVLTGERDARKKDGVLNVIGQVADTLMKVQISNIYVPRW